MTMTTGITPAPGRDDVLTAWKNTPARGALSRSGHAGQFREVLTALRAGTPPPVTPAQSRRTMSLVAVIYASAAAGRPVRPGDLAPGTPFYDSMNGGRRNPRSGKPLVNHERPTG